MGLDKHLRRLNAMNRERRYYEAFMEGARAMERLDTDNLDNPEDIAEEMRDAYLEWREDDA